MMKEELLNKKIEDTLNAADGIKRAEANPFIYTKITEKLKNRGTGIQSLFSASYVFRFAVILMAAVLLNIFTYFNYSSDDSIQNTDSNTRTENLKSFAKEYSITGTTYNY